MILTVTLNPAVDFSVFGNDFTPHRTNRGRDAAPEPGGKGNNAARIARLLGCDVMATGFVGGFTGDFIESGLRREGIHTGFLAAGGMTRITVSFIEQGAAGETKIVPDGPEISPQEETGFLDHFELLIKTNGFSIIALCGSLPRGVGDDYYGKLIDIAKHHDVPVILDTAGSALASGIAHTPFLIKPNLEEAYQLCGQCDEAELFSKLKVFSGKTGMTALTMGERGAVFISHEGAFRVFSNKAAHVSSIGAGDAFIGGFAAAYERFGIESDEVFKWAVAAGTSTAGSKGLMWPGTRFDDALRDIVVEPVMIG